MRIVVVGDGKVGFLLTKLLAREGHDVVVIDRNEEILRDVQEKLDVAIVTGNGASVQIQREAGVRAAVAACPGASLEVFDIKILIFFYCYICFIKCQSGFYCIIF